MKYLARLFAVLSLAVACVFAWSGDLAAMAAPSPIVAESAGVNAFDAKLRTEFGQKIDLNNTNIRAFRKYRGMYPTLAALVMDNAPFESVDEVFEIEGLSDRQKEILESNRENFMVSDPEAFLNEGDERINNGIY